VQEEFFAYQDGWADGVAARRDDVRATDPATGRDYRVGFLDGRLEMFRLNTRLRRIADNDAG